MGIIDSIIGMFTPNKNQEDNKAVAQDSHPSPSNTAKQNVSTSSNSGKAQPSASGKKNKKLKKKGKKANSFNNQEKAPVKKMKIYNLIIIDH